MSDNAATPPAPDPDNHRPSTNAYEIVDGRKHWRFWIPRYIIGQYAERIGPRGIAIYNSLAWWVTDDAPHHRPSLREIGAKAGVSRATVWRGLRVLQAERLIEVEAQVGATGRRAHLIRLVHPPGIEGENAEDGTGVAGGSNLSAPSDKLNYEFNGGENAPPADDLRDQDPPAWLPDCNRLVGIWNELLVQTNADLRVKSIRDAQLEIAELLRRGWPAERLEASLKDPNRDRTLWPRQWRKTLPSRPPKVARTPPDPAEVAHKRAQAAATQEKNRAEVARLKEECGGTLNPLDKRYRRPKSKQAAAELPGEVKDQPPPAAEAGGSAG